MAALPRHGGRARSFGQAEEGQLMLLAGIVITIAFLLTSLTLSQVASLERQAAAEVSSEMPAEWRFLHARIATNLESAVSPDLTVAAFKTTTFPIIASTFRNIEAEKGYDATLRLADNMSFFNKSELALVVAGLYNATASDGGYDFREAYDGTSDGVLWYSTCPDTSRIGGCIVGVLVFVEMTDASSTMSEVILFSVNDAPT